VRIKIRSKIPDGKEIQENLLAEISFGYS